jgi:hypothetical protein
MALFVNVFYGTALNRCCFSDFLPPISLPGARSLSFIGRLPKFRDFCLVYPSDIEHYYVRILSMVVGWFCQLSFSIYSAELACTSSNGKIYT